MASKKGGNHDDVGRLRDGEYIEIYYNGLNQTIQNNATRAYILLNIFMNSERLKN